MVTWLLHKGAKSHISLFASKQTPLMAAARRNARDAVESLLGARDAGAALAAVDAAGLTAAQLCGTPGIRELLLRSAVEAAQGSALLRPVAEAERS